RLLSIYSPQAWYGGGQFFAPNPEFGATIVYYLHNAGSGDVTVRIADQHGTPVRTLRGTARAGLNSVVWDMRREARLPESPRDGSSGGAGASAGPLVLPGPYTVTIGGLARPLKGDVRIEGDPRVSVPDGDRRLRQAALLDLYALVKTLAAARTSAA